MTPLGMETVVDKRYTQQLASLPVQFSPSAEPDEITLAELKPNYLKYTSRNTDNRLAVFSQIYYPYGWQAYIDGQKAEHIRVNYALRGMVIPAGQHTVEFKFEPASLATGRLISLIGTVLVLLLVGWTVYKERAGVRAGTRS